MTFDEWWEATKNLEDTGVPEVLKKALKELAYEAWCESRYQQNPTSRLTRRQGKPRPDKFDPRDVANSWGRSITLTDQKPRSIA